MHKHDLDPASLISGLIFVMVAGAYGLARTTSTRLRWEVTLPVALVVVGLAVITMVVARMSRREPVLAADETDIESETAAAE